MIDYAKMKVGTLRQDIIEKGILSGEEVNKIKGKSALVELHKRLFTEDEEVDQNVLLKSDNLYQGVETHTVPEYGSEEWSAYVMDQFLPSELDKNGHPKINGLRRLVGLLIGDILSSGPSQIFPSHDPDGPGRASAVVDIIIDAGGTPVKFSACADSWHGNTDKEYAVFPLAMAETRAESRALKKALGLAEVSAEELTSQNTAEVVERYTNKLDTEGEWEDGPIKDEQIKVINTLCKRLEIDVDQFINSGESTYEDISRVSRSNAIKMIKQLNKYQTSKSEIPETIKETIDEN